MDERAGSVKAGTGRLHYNPPQGAERHSVADQHARHGHCTPEVGRERLATQGSVAASPRSIDLGGARDKGQDIMADITFDRMNRALAGSTSRRQALKLIGGSVAGGFALAGGLKATAAPPAQGTGIDVVGSVSGAMSGAFEGTLNNLVATLDRATDTINISGTLSGLVDGVEEIAGDFTAVLDSLTADDASCQILFLDLGPLFLDLLGLQVDLSRITLDITAVPGAGNLLGNLLCAVAGLLDNPSGNLAGITNLLNRIFRILG